jgi:hypothetical protein
VSQAIKVLGRAQADSIQLESSRLERARYEAGERLSATVWTKP